MQAPRIHKNDLMKQSERIDAAESSIHFHWKGLPAGDILHGTGCISFWHIAGVPFVHENG